MHLGPGVATVSSNSVTVQFWEPSRAARWWMDRF